MTTEQKLSAVIEAQVKGRFERYRWAVHEYYSVEIIGPAGVH